MSEEEEKEEEDGSAGAGGSSTYYHVLWTPCTANCYYATINTVSCILILNPQQMTELLRKPEDPNFEKEVKIMKELFCPSCGQERLIILPCRRKAPVPPIYQCQGLEHREDLDTSHHQRVDSFRETWDSESNAVTLSVLYEKPWMSWTRQRSSQSS